MPTSDKKNRDVFYFFAFKTHKQIDAMPPPPLVNGGYTSWSKQGRIVHRSGLNNENNKNENKNSLKSKMKDFIFNSTIVKSELKRRI